MTAPRRVLQGTTYLVTRRCSERRFFLRPSERTTAIFSYLLAVAASRYGILVHAFCVMSNHFHLVVTDPHARLPDFHRYLDALVARALNCSLGRWQAFWDRDSYSAVALDTPAAILEKIVYVLANPVAAGLVRRGRDWPGLWSDPALIGAEPVTFERPKAFFRERGPMPASAQLRLDAPPGFEDRDALVEALCDALREAEEGAAAEVQRRGGAVLGAKRVIAQRPDESPGSRESRRGLRPRVAGRNRWRRIESLIQLREFVCAHRDALDAWRGGARDVIFPPGTWLMRVLHGVRCAAPA
jgi:REP element-mobilizing transposase RayT